MADTSGNGRIGRLILLKECLKHDLTPFVIAENLRRFYYLGLRDWRKGRHARLLDTTGSAWFFEVPEGWEMVRTPPVLPAAPSASNWRWADSCADWRP